MIEFYPYHNILHSVNTQMIKLIINSDYSKLKKEILNSELFESVLKCLGFLKEEYKQIEEIQKQRQQLQAQRENSSEGEHSSLESDQSDEDQKEIQKEIQKEKELIKGINKPKYTKEHKNHRLAYTGHFLEIAFEIQKKLKENDIFFKEKLNSDKKLNERWTQFTNTILKTEQAKRNEVLGGQIQSQQQVDDMQGFTSKFTDYYNNNKNNLEMEFVNQPQEVIDDFTIFQTNKKQPVIVSQEIQFDGGGFEQPQFNNFGGGDLNQFGNFGGGGMQQQPQVDQFRGGGGLKQTQFVGGFDGGGGLKQAQFGGGQQQPQFGGGYQRRPKKFNTEPPRIPAQQQGPGLNAPYMPPQNQMGGGFQLKGYGRNSDPLKYVGVGIQQGFNQQNQQGFGGFGHVGGGLKETKIQGGDPFNTFGNFQNQMDDVDEEEIIGEWGDDTDLINPENSNNEVKLEGKKDQEIIEEIPFTEEDFFK